MSESDHPDTRPEDPSPGSDASPAKPDSESVTVTGLFTVDLVPRFGKSLQGEWLHRDDEESLLLSYRPVYNHRQFHERRVRVTGEFYEPTGQRLMAEHFRVHDIDLLEGQRPRDVTEGKLPSPTVVETESDLSELDETLLEVHKFVVAFGNLEEHPDSYSIAERQLTLEDGTSVRTDVRSRAPSGSVSVAGDIRLTDGEWYLRGFAVCEDRQPRCGVRDEFKDRD